ncbi:MAG TPA: hypothetical protein VKT77_00405, partial [Chthonomonadaceae bacterium]|nr:hypothetical protein [Chthonomonadaceae bacterium]
MPTRTIFFHIGPAAQTVFYLLAAASLAICFYGFYRRWRLWRVGKPIHWKVDWRARIGALIEQAFAHRRVVRRPLAGIMHVLIFYGFLVLFIGTVIVAIEHYGAFFFGHHWFYRGAFYLACKVTLDLFGLGLAIATVVALARRYLARPASLGNDWRDPAFLVLLLGATVTGFLLEGAGIAAD